MVFPLGSHLAEMRKLVNADVNICMYREFGRGCARRWSKPYLQAPIGLHSTTKFLRKLGEMLGLDPEPFIEREKHTTIKPVWDLWRSVTQDFFATASFGIVANETYAAASATSSKTTWAALRLRGGAHAGKKTDNEAVRELIQTRPRWCCSAATTSACTWPRSRRTGPRLVHPGVASPGRHPPPYRHAVHGLCRGHLSGSGSLQRAVRRAVPHPAAGHRRGRGALPWDADAQRLLEDLVEDHPVLIRISAAKRLRDTAERAARIAGEDRVSVERLLQSGGVDVSRLPG
jgi:3,8-divinyl chlorophyllide a/chlorophyllide a reductase subunit Z